MRALLTGASSFTGAWLARALHDEGIAVTATCRRRLDDCAEIERARLESLAAPARMITGFTSDAAHLALAFALPVEILCLHGATVGDHRGAGFEPLAALAADVSGLDLLLEAFIEQGGRVVILTGSIFEADAGQGSAPRGALSAYGLAKTLTRAWVRDAVERRGLTLGHWVIPHPFGPLEKPGLTTSLARSWLRGETPTIQQPRLVRDFIPADALAQGYARFARRLTGLSGSHCCQPSLWPMPTADFVARFAAELGARLGLDCRFVAASAPSPTSEPLIRIGTDPLAPLLAGWDERRSWDRLAEWYEANDWRRSISING